MTSKLIRYRIMRSYCSTSWTSY